MQRIPIDALGDLFEQPWLATLATYRKDGTVLLSPVWFEWDGAALTVSLVHGDWKELHIRRTPQVSLLIAEEASYPGRAVEASGTAFVTSDPNAEVILRIASRYLGDEVAARWVNDYPDMKWDYMRMVPDKLRALDHRNVDYLADAQPKYPPSTEWRIEMVRCCP